MYKRSKDSHLEILGYVVGILVLLLTTLSIFKKKYKKAIHYLIFSLAGIIFSLNYAVENIVLTFFFFIVLEYIIPTDYNERKYVAKRTKNLLNILRFILLAIIISISTIVYLSPIKILNDVKHTHHSEMLIAVIVIFCLIDSIKGRAKWKF